MTGKPAQHGVLGDEAEVAEQKKSKNQALHRHRRIMGRESVRLPVVPGMTTAEGDVLHLEEVTASVKLMTKRETKHSINCIYQFLSWIKVLMTISSSLLSQNKFYNYYTCQTFYSSIMTNSIPQE